MSTTHGRQETGQPAASSSNTAPNGTVPSRIVQPKPQQLVSRSGPSAILVSTRQKGNPVLDNIRSHPWEWSDIPADFVVGATTCVLFLSIKYHKLHPEYIYNRIRGLQGKYLLRIILTLVDVDDHEETLKELSKTSIINNVTVMLSWSADQAARYLELFKQYEHGAATAIQGHRSESYVEKMVDFITIPRGINKTDAASLVANFGSIRTAITAEPEEVALVPGFGSTKVKRWCSTVREPFRTRKAAKRGMERGDTHATLSRDVSRAEREEVSGPGLVVRQSGVEHRPKKRTAEEMVGNAITKEATPQARAEGSGNGHVIDEESLFVEDEEEEQEEDTTAFANKRSDNPLSSGVAAALAKLRES